MEQPFKPMQTVYLSNGQKARYVCQDGDEHIVRPIVRARIDGAFGFSEREIEGEVRATRFIYAEPPIEDIDEGIDDARETLEQLSRDIAKANQDKHEAELDLANTFSVLANYGPLAKAGEVLKDLDPGAKVTLYVRRADVLSGDEGILMTNDNPIDVSAGIMMMTSKRMGEIDTSPLSTDVVAEKPFIDAHGTTVVDARGWTGVTCGEAFVAGNAGDLHRVLSVDFGPPHSVLHFYESDLRLVQANTGDEP